MIVVGVDVGGTFTDLILADLTKGAVTIHKVSSTNANPAEAVVVGIREICDMSGVAPEDIGSIFHGTTVATNAMLENKGARTGMITNDGFRDILHIGRHQRVHHYSIMQDLPWQARPLVRRRYRKTVACRLDAAGRELEPLDESGVRTAARQLSAEGVEAIVIGFLFSYINPEHERRAADIVREELPDIFVTTSSDVAPQFREFERFTTASMSAFVGPKVRTYVAELQKELIGLGIDSELHIMASNGGVATPKLVSERPAVTLMSGLVAGVRGGAWIGEHADAPKLITLDIGGTSADIGIVQDGQFTETDARSANIAGFPVLLPMIDIHTIGAGGGSIAHVDRGGAFRVGPQSAGAEPGPAAYGKGGQDPTVTDANLALGRLIAEDFLGGNMELDLSAAKAAIGGLAKTLGRSDDETAEGVLTVLNSNMANAIRSRTVQKGIDPREFTLCGFGGAGPLHAAGVAEMLGIKRVLIPPHPGITSAMGLLTADLQYDALRTAFETKGSVDSKRLDRLFADMEADLKGLFAKDDVATDKVTLQRIGDLRYVGQGYELKVEIPDGPVTEATLEQVWQAFHRQHQMEYGHAFEDSPIEIVTIKLRGFGEVEKLTRLPENNVTGAAEPVGTGQCVFRIGEKLDLFDTPYFRRADLTPGHDQKGPAILLQKDSTTVIPPGWTFASDAYGNVLMQNNSSVTDDANGEARA